MDRELFHESHFFLLTAFNAFLDKKLLDKFLYTYKLHKKYNVYINYNNKRKLTSTCSN